MRGRFTFDGKPPRATGLGKCTGRAARKYKRLWARARRADPEYQKHQEQLASARRERVFPPQRKKLLRLRQRGYKAKWLAKAGTRVRKRREERARYQRKCFYCGRYRKKRMRTVTRTLLLGNGRSVVRKVIYCGSC
jgi:hypothetical protein